MRRSLSLTYTDSVISEYNVKYLIIKFLDNEGNTYIWLVDGNTTAYIQDFTFIKGLEIALTANVEESVMDGNKIFLLKRVKINK